MSIHFMIGTTSACNKPVVISTVLIEVCCQPEVTIILFEELCKIVLADLEVTPAVKADVWDWFAADGRTLHKMFCVHTECDE